MSHIDLLRRILHRSLRVRRLERFYEAQRTPFLFSAERGLKFELHPSQFVDREIATAGIYERRFLRLFRSMLPKGSVLLDVGAHIGNHALYLHDLCSEVHCFEPSPPALDRLRRNLALNSVRNVYVHPYGLGADERVAQFSVNKSDNLGQSGFFARDGWERLELLIRNGDAVVRELAIRRVDFIKIDVEGLEEEVVQGLRATIARYRPLLAFEHHHHLAPEGTFGRIAQYLPEYIIAEPTFSSGDKLRQALYHLANGTRMTLHAVDEPEPRTYECLLAIPQEHRASARIA